MTRSDYGFPFPVEMDGPLKHGAMEEGYWKRICDDGLTLRRMFETAIGDST